MAGLGRKLWTRQTLSSADLQGYLQDQVVMRFPNAAARQSLLPAPTEGMLSTLDDTDQVERHDGAGWKPAQYGASRGKMWRTIGGSAGLATGTDTVCTMQQSRVSGGFAYNADALTLPFDGRYDLDVLFYLTNNAAGNCAVWIRRIRAGVANNVTGQKMGYKASPTIDVQDGFRVPDVPYKAGDQLALTFYSYVAGIAFYGAAEPVGCSLTATYAGPLNGATPL